MPDRHFGFWSKGLPRIVEFDDTLPRSATGTAMWRALQEKEAARAA